MRVEHTRLFRVLFPEKVFPYKNYYLSRKLGLIYLAIPKNANSFLRAAFLMNSEAAEDFRPNEETAVEYMRRTRGRKVRLPNLRALGQRQYTRIVVLRNPMNRLVSAYLDKFVKSPDQITGPRQAYIRKASQVLGKPLCPATFTFEDFLRYTVTLDDSVLDGHWKPQYRYLDGRMFDFYGDVENLQPTYEFFRERFGIDVAIAHSRVRSPKHTAYTQGLTRSVACAAATPLELNALPAYPRPAAFFDGGLLDLFLQKYAPDLDLYATKLGYLREDLLRTYRCSPPTPVLDKAASE